MKISEQLQVYAVRYRWAYEELVVDAKQAEANQLYSGNPMEAYRYLKQHLAEEGKSSRWLVVKAMRKELRLSKQAVPLLDHKSFLAVRAERKRILSRYPHIMEELLYEAKAREAEQVCVTVGSMFSYLQGVIGSAKGTLAALKYIVHVQGHRSKSLPVS